MDRLRIVPNSDESTLVVRPLGIDRSGVVAPEFSLWPVSSRRDPILLYMCDVKVLDSDPDNPTFELPFTAARRGEVKMLRPAFSALKGPVDESHWQP